MPPPIDYDKLAQQRGGTVAVDYDALAAQHGGTVQNAAPSQTEPEKQGFLSSFTDQNAITAGLKSLGHAVMHPGDTTEAIGRSIANPYDPQGIVAQQVVPIVQNTFERGKAAFDAARAGNKAGAASNLISAIPVIGPGLDKATDQYANKNYRGEMGTLAGMVSNLALPKAQESSAPVVRSAVTDLRNADVGTALRNAGAKVVPSLVDGPPESLMTRAVKPGKNNVKWVPDVQKAVPLMKSAEQQLGRPIAGIDDALDAANIAKKDVWQQYKARLGPAAEQGAVIDGNLVADEMMKSIDKRTLAQNPALVQKVQEIADTYRRPLSLDEAEDFLQSANKDLNSYYAKNKVGQQVAQNDPETAYTVAEAQALRSALYSKLDQLSGPGAAQLKQAYGSLTNVEKELAGRKLVADRQAPESLSEQLSTVRGAGKIAKGVATANPGDVLEGVQNIAVSRALKARNSSDAMITRAFQKAQPATPFPLPASPRFAGLLDRGAIPMNAPASTPSAPSAPAIGIDATTRAQRLGLLLPEKTGGPIELPYIPEMSGGERLAALMQYLRSHPQKGLPSKASAIRLPPVQ